MKNKMFLLLALLCTALWVHADIVTTPEKGVDYTFNFRDESIVPKDAPGNVTIDYGILRIYCGPKNAYKYNGAQHGVAFKEGNYLELDVAGNVTLKIGGCQYNKEGNIVVSDKNGIYEETESTASTCDGTIDFNYLGAATTLKIAFEVGVYVPQIEVISVPDAEPSDGLTDVWDFGAAQLDESIYRNNMTVDVINSWYTDIAPGTTGVAIPGSNPRTIEVGKLKMIIKGAGERHYTNTPGITCYGNGNVPVTIAGVELNGALYFNTTSCSATSRCLQVTVAEDDEILVYATAQGGEGELHFEFTSDASLQSDVLPISAEGTLARFAAKQAGIYSIYQLNKKPFIYRVVRKDAVYTTVSGTVNTVEAQNIPAGYGIVFTNEAGKSWTAAVKDGSYSVKLPQGYTYEIGLSDANGYIISNGTSVATGTDAVQTQNITIKQIDLFTVNGNIEGLDAIIGKMKLTYAPAVERVFIPEPKIDITNKTYTVQLEPNVDYTIYAEGVNDYVLTNNTVNVTAAQTMNLVFESKPLYAVTVDADGLNDEQKAKLGVTFTNLNEEGYAYVFASLADAKLRDGVYSVVVSGLDEYPLQQALTSNLKIEGQPANKSVKFKTVTEWGFGDKEIKSGDAYYNGLALTGGAKNEQAKGHLVAGNGATVVVPVAKGDKMTVTYYYNAYFSINGGNEITCDTSAGSTNKTESVEYINETDNNTVTITFGGDKSSYITNIRIDKILPYAETIYVGAEKAYKTINEAMDAVRAMERPNGERVKIMIEPGDYEEMLVVDVPNVSLINASLTPSIALKDKGVNIDENAVRITSYYGHGYNYYSMGTDQKWNAEVLAVNKENGYTNYKNTGSGTNNGSYWNATVVVSANGFEAENIIFENSYNQYISKKESEDVVELSDGNKGVRPTEYGNTEVQDKSFVERAAAIALKGSDKVVLYNCRVVGRQDSFYGGDNVRAAIYKGVMMGGTDYIFGEMSAVFYKTQLAMNTSEDKNDVSYITAAKQNSGRGYLMYECRVTSAEPGVETASAYRSKPGYFGRPWQPNTSEVVFYNTTVETSNNPNGDSEDKGTGDYLASFDGASLIRPIGWNSSLSGESPLCYEYGTIEKSMVSNATSRASWSTVLAEPKLADGTEITCLNFTKGNDGWDPISELIEKDATGISCNPVTETGVVSILADGDKVFIQGIQSASIVRIYSMDGSLVKVLCVNEDVNVSLASGLWIVRVSNAEGAHSAKVAIK